MPPFRIHKAQSPSNGKSFMRYALSLLAMAVCLVSSLGMLLWAGEYTYKHSPQLQQTLLAQAEKKLPFSFQARSLELDLVPWPRLIVNEVQVELPEIGPASADKIEISPSQSQLIQGKFSLSKLVVTRPSFNLPFGPVLDEEEVFQIHDLSKVISSIFPHGAKLHIRSGSVYLSSPKRQGLSLDHIFADLTHAQEYILNLKATSELASDVSLSLQVPQTLDHFKGRLKIQDLQPEYVFQLIERPDFPVWLGPGHLNTDISFHARGMSQASARINLTSKGLMLCTQDDECNLQGLKLQTEIQIHGSSIRAALHHLSLAHPEFSVSGHAATDLAHPWLQLNLRAQDLSLSPLSQASLDLFPSSKFLNQLFGIIKAGRIPYVSVSTHGATSAGLKRELFIESEMQNGTVLIPRLNMQAHNVGGNARVKDKILSGSGLRASLNQAQARKVSFRYGLEDTEDRPFDLSLQFAGPVHDMPQILHNTVQNKPFQREIEGLSDLQGQAQGEMQLTRTGQGVDFEIQTHEFNLQGSHERLPWPVALQGKDMHIKNHGLSIDTARGDLGSSRIHFSGTDLSWHQQPELRIQDVRGQLDLDSFWPWLLSLPLDRQDIFDQLTLDGQARVKDTSLHIPFSRTGETRISLSARVDDIRARHPVLPQTLTLSSGQIKWGEEDSILRDLRLSMGDAQIALNGNISGSLLDWMKPGLNLDFSGHLGPDTARFVQETANVPSSFSLQGPLQVYEARLKQPAAGEFDLQARIGFDPDLEVAADLFWTPESLKLRQFQIQDGDHSASLAMQGTDADIEAQFSGQLKASSLQRLFSAPYLGDNAGIISGQFQAEWVRSPLRLINANGELTLTGLELDPGPRAPPLSISRLEFKTDSHQGLQVTAGEFIWADKELTLSGYIQPQTDEPTLLDLSIQANSLDSTWIQALVNQLGLPGTDDPGNAPQFFDFQGQISTKIANFTHHERSFSPLHITWVLDPGGPWTVHLLDKTALCGISLPGKVTVQPDQVYFGLAPSTQELDLSRSLECLFQAKDIATGVLNLRGNLQGTAPKTEDLLSNLNGELDLTVNDGRLLRFTVLSKLIELLNTTEIFFGTLPDLENEGIRFSQLQSTILFKGSRTSITQGLVDGHSMEIGFYGDIDLQAESLELTVLVAPLKTLDRLMKKIPLISGLTGGNLVTIPVRISGHWNNPKVTPLSPQAVSKELIDLMRRTLELPFKIFNPFMRHENEEK